MSPAAQFYLSGLLVLFFITVIAVWGLDLQYSVAGIYNFAYIMFQAAGAYTAAVLALPPVAAYQAGESYIGGFDLPFPLPLLGAVAAGALLALPVGLLAVRRLVWLLDEPTSALDAAGQQVFAGLMRDHLADGGIIIAATHAPLGIEAMELRMGGAA